MQETKYFANDLKLLSCVWSTKIIRVLWETGQHFFQMDETCNSRKGLIIYFLLCNLIYWDHFKCIDNCLQIVANNFRQISNVEREGFVSSPVLLLEGILNDFTYTFLFQLFDNDYEHNRAYPMPDVPVIPDRAAIFKRSAGIPYHVGTTGQDWGKDMFPRNGAMSAISGTGGNGLMSPAMYDSSYLKQDRKAMK